MCMTGVYSLADMRKLGKEKNWSEEEDQDEKGGGEGRKGRTQGECEGIQRGGAGSNAVCVCVYVLQVSLLCGASFN